MLLHSIVAVIGILVDDSTLLDDGTKSRPFFQDEGEGESLAECMGACDFPIFEAFDVADSGIGLNPLDRRLEMERSSG